MGAVMVGGWPELARLLFCVVAGVPLKKLMTLPPDEVRESFWARGSLSHSTLEQ
jgi:hypothetical protein